MTARNRPVGREKALSSSGRTVSPARSSAFEILSRVEVDGAYASVLLAAADNQLRTIDRGLSYELVMGVLRWQGWLDALIAHYAQRDTESLDAPVRRILRIGLYELRFLSRIPPSATVNEAVNLTYKARLRSATGLVNAVLRRAIRESDYDPASQIENPNQQLAMSSSHPAWLIDRWVKAFGFQEAEAFAKSNNESPPVAFRFVPDKLDEADVLKGLSDAGGSITRSHLTPNAWRIDGAGPAVRKLAADGRIYLQDEASQLVSHVMDAKPGQRILDACSAPGSKTTHISALVPNAAIIIAGDLYEHRLRTVRGAIDRQASKGISLLVHDATVNLPFADQSFDRVLVDAPCSGTGTLRRNPEIKWRISAQDILDMAKRQRRIITNAARVVCPGGRMIYSTCSVEPEENEKVVSDFVSENTLFTPVVDRSDEFLHGRDGSIRTWPHKDGSDGFFIAALERRR